MLRTLLPCTVLLGSVVMLTGCMSCEPYYRTDVWRPSGANAANLAAMVANPRDLIRGHGDDHVLAKAPASAVEQVWSPKGSGGGGGGGGNGGDAGGGAGLAAPTAPGG